MFSGDIMEVYNDTYCVYIHTNKINNKKYVGQTIHGDNPNLRWKNGSGYRNQLYFYQAIQKYGWDNFEHEVVASNLTKEESDNFEKLLIKKIYTYDRNFGYNLTLGGGGSSGCRVTEETRRKMSEARIGVRLSDETKSKIGAASKGRNVGRKHTFEELEKMRKSKVRNPNKRGGAPKGLVKSEDVKRKIQEGSHKKQVAQKNLNGDILKYYNSLSNASRETGISLGNISSCCNGRCHTAGGFIWEFVD